MHRIHSDYRSSTGLKAFSLGLLAACVCSVAAAQEPGGGPAGLFGGGGLGGSAPRESGAYASPSSIPNASLGDIGVNLPKQLDKFEPIALPDIRGGQPDGSGLELPMLPGYAPGNLPALDLLKRRQTLHLEAHLVKDGPSIPKGLVWRLFSPTLKPDGKLPLVASAKGGPADFDIPAGSYLMHIGFGRAGVTRRIDFDGRARRENVLLDAGGLKLNAVSVGGAAIPADKLIFDVYAKVADTPDERLVGDDLPPNTVIPFNAGAYHIVSRYGDENAEVHGEVKVEAGKTTEVTLQQHAAQLTMKLVREKGGEAIADTAWQVTTINGDPVRESVGAFPSMVLAEGEYTVVAKNRDKTYQRDFDVEAGTDADVELLTTDVLAPTDSSEGSGD